MFERYTEKARRAIFFARYEASVCGSPQIDTEHLLLGILRENKELAARLALHSKHLDQIREQIRGRRPQQESTSTSLDLPVSEECQKALLHAAEEATRLHHAQIKPEHLMLGILLEKDCSAAVILRGFNITAPMLRSEAEAVSRQMPGQPQFSFRREGMRDLAETARHGKIGRLVGRELEMERVLQILVRRTRNSVALIGAAGIGKTAIAMGLARRMADGEVPEALTDRDYVRVDPSVLVKGFGGALPARPILFVRGLFNLSANSEAWGAVEALLCRGSAQCIATGSPEGLQQILENSPGLARHFEVVGVAMVTEHEAIRILEATKVQFESYHKVKIGEDAVRAAVRLSGLVLPGRNLPDRAMDLLDDAATAVKLRRERKQGGDEVTTADVEASAAARSGAALEILRRPPRQEQPSEEERILGLIASTAGGQEWVAGLAAYLSKCTPEQAKALSRAITEAKRKARRQGA